MFWRKQANSARIQGCAKAVLTSSSPGFLSVTNVCVVGWRLDPKADSRKQDVNSEHWPMNQSNIKKPPNVTQRCQTHWKSVATCGVGDLAKTDIIMAIEKWSEVLSSMQYHPESVWLSQIRSWCSKSICGKTQWSTISDRFTSREASPEHYWSSVEISYQHPKLALKCPSRSLEIYFFCLKNKQACLTEFRLCWRIKEIISVIDFQAH